MWPRLDLSWDTAVTDFVREQEIMDKNYKYRYVSSQIQTQIADMSILTANHYSLTFLPL